MNGVIFIGLIILIRFFYIQVLNAEGYHETVSKKINFKKKVKGDRGKIYDRNGIALAENITKVTFWTNTNHDIDKKSIASFLYQEFDIPESSTIELINSKNTNYLPFKKDIILEDITKTINKAESIKGLYLDKKTKRFYHYKNACSHLIGHIDYNGKGKSGVELQFDSVLKGNEKIETFDKSRSSRFLNKSKESFNSNLYGNDIHLTIDIQLQNILFEAIKRG